MNPSISYLFHAARVCTLSIHLNLYFGLIGNIYIIYSISKNIVQTVLLLYRLILMILVTKCLHLAP